MIGYQEGLNIRNNDLIKPNDDSSTVNFIQLMSADWYMLQRLAIFLM